MPSFNFSSRNNCTWVPLKVHLYRIMHSSAYLDRHKKTPNSAVERFALHSKLLNINKTQLKNCNRKLAPLYGVSLKSGAVLFFCIKRYISRGSLYMQLFDRGLHKMQAGAWNISSGRKWENMVHLGTQVWNGGPLLLLMWSERLILASGKRFFLLRREGGEEFLDEKWFAKFISK